MSEKRSNGSGSVFQRKDGRWVAQVVDPVTGKMVSRYRKTKNLADKARREMLAAIETGQPAQESNQTLQAYAEEWLSSRAARKRSDSTVYAYRKRCELYVFPLIGAVRLNRLNVRDIDKVLDAAVAQGLSHGTVKGIKDTLGSMIQDAVKARLMASNPARAADMPIRSREKEVPMPSTDDVRWLFHSVDAYEVGAGREVGNIFRTCILTGARIGEILAMKWGDIDPKERLWKVSRTATRDRNGKTQMGDETKTKKSRQVALSDMQIAVLKEQRKLVRARQVAANVWTDLDLVFPDRFGQLRDSRNLKRLAEKFYPEWEHGFHSLRRWFASYGLLNPSASDVQMARLMGHSKTNMTKDVYGKRLAEGALKIVDAIGDAVS